MVSVPGTSLHVLAPIGERCFNLLNCLSRNLDQDYHARLTCMGLF